MSTTKAAAGGGGYEIEGEKIESERKKKEEEGFALLLCTGSIKASRETDKLSALQQNAISSQSFSLSH